MIYRHETHLQHNGKLSRGDNPLEFFLPVAGIGRDLEVEANNLEANYAGLPANHIDAMVAFSISVPTIQEYIALFENGHGCARDYVKFSFQPALRQSHEGLTSSFDGTKL